MRRPVPGRALLAQRPPTLLQIGVGPLTRRQLLALLPEVGEFGFELGPPLLNDRQLGGRLLHPLGPLALVAEFGDPLVDVL